MNRLRFPILFCSSLAVAAFACGGISDPTRGSGSENVATVSGALTGVAVPANARVALVYRKVTTTSTGSTPNVEVGSDVAVIGGKFTMNLSVPAADYFTPVEGHSFGSISDSPSAPPPISGGEAPSTDPDPPPPVPAGGSTSGGGGAFGAATKLAPRELVGGQITEPMTAAVAGFIVYADTNGNGKLDLEGQYAASPDQILGGNQELVLVYLQSGGALDYEKMRDKSGILPASGFNLAWTEGRWLPLDVVELKLSAKAQLPGPVCASWGYGSSGSGSGEPLEEAEPSTLPPSSGGTGGTGGSAGYPSPTDPDLQCAPDGRSFTHGSSSTCPPLPPPPVGLCAGDGNDVARPCASARAFTSLKPGQPVPEGWPCTVAPDADGGGAPDSGPIMDAGAGPG